MRNMKKVLFATLVGATTLMAAASVDAAVINSPDQKFTMETPNDNWKLVAPEQNSIMTLSNGADEVMVECFDKEAVLQDLANVLPMPTVSHDAFEEEVLTYYSTAKEVYMITGLAKTKDSIKDVRFVVNSIQLADHTTAVAPVKPQETEKTTEKETETETEAKVEKTDEMYTLYNEMGDTVIVYKYSDGNYRSDDGTLFQWVEDQHWVDYFGNHYSTNGTSINAERTGTAYTLENEMGDMVTVFEYSDGSLRSDDDNLFQAIGGNEFVDYYGNHYKVFTNEGYDDENEGYDDGYAYDEESYDGSYDEAYEE